MPQYQVCTFIIEFRPERARSSLYTACGKGSSHDISWDMASSKSSEFEIHQIDVLSRWSGLMHQIPTSFFSLKACGIPIATVNEPIG